ncbi:unnamed protein product, partial [Symbiodinium necroappetens]
AKAKAKATPKATPKATAKAKANPKAKAKPSSSSTVPTGGETKGKAKAEPNKKKREVEDEDKQEPNKKPKQEKEEAKGKKADPKKDKDAEEDTKEDGKKKTVQSTFKNMTGPGQRQKQTEFINRIIHRDGHGNLQLAGTKKAFLSGSQSLQNQRTFELEDKGMSQTLFMHKFNMTPESLKEAFNNGEVDIAYHSGKPYVSWRIMTSRNKDMRKTDINLQGKRMAVSEREAGQMQTLLDDISLEMPMELPDMPSNPMIADGRADDAGTGTGSGSGSAGPAAEEKAMTAARWTRTKDLADQGVNTCGQLQGKVEKMLEQMAPSDSCWTQLRRDVNERIETFRKEMESLKKFQELPKNKYPGEVTWDKVNSFLQQQVQVVKAINEDIAGVRGKLDARAKADKQKEKEKEKES